MKGKTMPAIYKLERNRLVICFGFWGNAERPIDFITPAESGWHMITFERIKE